MKQILKCEVKNKRKDISTVRNEDIKEKDVQLQNKLEGIRKLYTKLSEKNKENCYVKNGGIKVLDAKLQKELERH